MTLGKRIKERRQELNMSVDELAKQLGKNRATVYRYEKGDIENIPVDVLEPLAKALHTTPQQLIGWKIDRKYLYTNVAKGSDMTIGDVIKSLRISSEMSIEEYSSELGISAADLKHYEDGDRQPPASTIRTIAEVQGINMFDVLEQYLMTDDTTTPQFTKMHLERSKRWHREFGRFNFEEEEMNQIFHYARFVVWSRDTTPKGGAQ